MNYLSKCQKILNKSNTLLIWKRIQISGGFRGGELALPPPLGRRTDAATRGHVS